MRAGSLDRQITVEKKQVTGDPTFGTEVITWVPLVALPGSPVVGERFAANVVDALPSRLESVLAEGVNLGRRQVRIRLRWRNDIDSSMRVTLHGETNRVMNIIGGPAEVGNRKEAIELLCEEVTS